MQKHATEIHDGVTHNIQDGQALHVAESSTLRVESRGDEERPFEKQRTDLTTKTRSGKEQANIY